MKQKKRDGFRIGMKGEKNETINWRISHNRVKCGCQWADKIEEIVQT
jgi:hypothetical protein